jgi:hypothetical protein
VKSEHQEKNRDCENVLEKIVQEKKFPELIAEKAKIEKTTIPT